MAYNATHRTTVIRNRRRVGLTLLVALVTVALCPGSASAIPRVAVMPDFVQDLGFVRDGQIFEWVVAHTNNGAAPLTLPAGEGSSANSTLVYWKGLHESGFNPLQPGATGTSTMGRLATYPPSGAGGPIPDTLGYNATWEDPTGNRLLVSASARVHVSPPAVLTPAIHSFGVVAVGASARMAFALANDGLRPIVPTSVTVADTANFTIEQSTCTGPVQPGQTCSFNAVFTPSAAGSLSTVITVTTDRGRATSAVVGEGIGTPAAFLDPSAHDFGTVELGQIATRAFAITNTGSGALTVGDISTAAPYSVQNNACTTVVAPAANCTFDIVFAPSEVGPTTGDVTVVTDAGSQTATLTGAGEGVPWAELELEGNGFFEPVKLGESSTRLFTVSNTGSRELTVGGITTAAPFSVGDSTCQARVAPGGNCTFAVVFAPTRVGSTTGEVAVATDGGNFLAAVAGAGIGVPNAAVAPESADFGDVEVGETAIRSFTVTNTGSADLFVSVGPAPAPFAIGTNECVGFVAPRSTCTFDVVFSPVAAGAATDEVTVLTSAVSETLTVDVTGAGIGVPAAELTPLTEDFADVRLGESETRTFTITNTGSRELTIEAITTVTPYEVVDDTCTAPMAADANCTFDVRFTPSDAGSVAGEVQVEANDGEHIATLTGTGVGLPIADLTPPEAQFGNVDVGQTSTRTFTVANAGYGPLTVTNIATAAPYSVLDNACAEPIAPAATCTFDVGFAPTSAGPAPGQVNVATSGGDRSAVLSGTGVGVASATLEPATFDFGTVTLLQSKPNVFTVRNTGSLPVTISSVERTGSNFFEITANECPPTLAVGESCTITVAFQPLGTSPVNGVLTVVTGTGDLDASLRGAGSFLAQTATSPPSETTTSAPPAATTTRPIPLPQLSLPPIILRIS